MGVEDGVPVGMGVMVGPGVMVGSCDGAGVSIGICDDAGFCRTRCDMTISAAMTPASRRSAKIRMMSVQFFESPLLVTLGVDSTGIVRLSCIETSSSAKKTSCD